MFFISTWNALDIFIKLPYTLGVYLNFVSAQNTVLLTGRKLFMQGYQLGAMKSRRSQKETKDFPNNLLGLIAFFLLDFFCHLFLKSLKTLSSPSSKKCDFIVFLRFLRLSNIGKKKVLL
jgi:hypothetical protein